MERLPPPSDGPALRAGALPLGAVLMQGITHIAPAAGLILSIQFIAREAGALTPLAYGIAFLIVLLLGLSLTQLARHLPSAGGYFTYLSRAVHPRAGFLTAWLYFLYDPTSTAINLAYMGLLIEQTLRAQAGLYFPWWAFLVAGALFVGWLCARGIKASVTLLALLGLLEIGIIIALCGAGLLRPGAAAAAGAAGTPRGLYLGVVLSIFCFTGFESVAPLAEESVEPRRNLPRAILASIALMGAFYLFSSWALLRGLGPGSLQALLHSEESPVFALARRLWGRAWVLVLFALLNSVLAVSIACTNAATRVFYAMGRAGALPRALGRVHPLHRTPARAVALQTALTLLIGLALGFLLGPAEEYFFLSVVMTLGMVLVYSAGNLGVFLYYRREQRARFRVLSHAVCPLVSTLTLLWVGVKSVYPLPPGAVALAPALVALWLLLGVLLLLVMKWSGREEHLLRLGALTRADAAADGVE